MGAGTVGSGGAGPGEVCSFIATGSGVVGSVVGCSGAGMSSGSGLTCALFLCLLP